VAILGPGAGVKALSDSFRLTSVPASGDFEISARIDCFVDPGGTGSAGLMVRASDDPGSPMVHLYLTSTIPTTGGVGTLKANYRRGTGKIAGTISITKPEDRNVTAFPIHLKLVRSGTTVSLQRSEDGVTFREIGVREIGTGSVQVDLPDATIIGLAATANGSGAVRASFSGVSGPAFSGVQPPEVPTNLQAVGGAKQATLTWAAPAGGAEGYVLYRDGAKLAELAAVTTYTDTGLADATQYCYQVSSKKGGAESAKTAQACATTSGVATGFKRGDADASGALDLTDAIFTLQHLFMGGTKPPCVDAADSDDSGALDLTDAIYVLQFLFMGGTKPLPPGPDSCGPDPTADDPFTACDYAKC
jgi:hypothetical protein